VEVPRDCLYTCFTSWRWWSSVYPRPVTCRSAGVAPACHLQHAGGTSIIGKAGRPNKALPRSASDRPNTTRTVPCSLECFRTNKGGIPSGSDRSRLTPFRSLSKDSRRGVWMR